MQIVKYLHLPGLRCQAHLSARLVLLFFLRLLAIALVIVQLDLRQRLGHRAILFFGAAQVIDGEAGATGLVLRIQIAAIRVPLLHEAAANLTWIRLCWHFHLVARSVGNLGACEGLRDHLMLALVLNKSYIRS